MKLQPIKSRFNQFLQRVKVAYKILAYAELSWAVLFIDKAGLKNLVAGDDVDIDISFHRLQEYNMWQLVKGASDSKDDIDMILGKAAFNAEAEEYSKRQNPN